MRQYVSAPSQPFTIPHAKTELVTGVHPPDPELELAAVELTELVLVLLLLELVLLAPLVLVVLVAVVPVVLVLPDVDALVPVEVVLVVEPVVVPLDPLLDVDALVALVPPEPSVPFIEEHAATRAAGSAREQSATWRGELKRGIVRATTTSLQKDRRRSLAQRRLEETRPEKRRAT